MAVATLAAAGVFLLSTLVSFCVLTGACLALVVVTSRDQASLGSAIVIFSPIAAPFLVVSVGLGLYASHRVYKKMGGFDPAE